MLQPDQNGVLATVTASAARRIFAYAVIFTLGALLIYTALVQPPAFGWLIFMLGFGASMIALAEKLRRATVGRLVLTEAGLHDDKGRVLATIDDIASISRGAFAMKPSNGFTLVLRSRQSRAWAPGLWWRLGKRVGVGGVTSAGQTKFMAEQIAMRIANRH